MISRGLSLGIARLCCRPTTGKLPVSFSRVGKHGFAGLNIRSNTTTSFTARQRTSVVRAVDVVGSTADQFARDESFAGLKLTPALVSALDSFGITQPTEIQALSIPAIIKGGDYLVGSHTGSGKTLAYLLPLVHLLKQQEANGVRTKPKRPRILVLGPTQELTEQITCVARQLAHHVRFSVQCLNASTRMPAQRKALAGPVDMVIATPQRFMHHLEEDNVYPGDIQWLVVDEADTMLVKDFGDDLRTIMKPLKLKKQGPADVVMVSATMTKDIRKLLLAQLPSATPLETTSLHRPVVGTRHAFMMQPPGRDKVDMLLELLTSDMNRKQRVLVFCNTVSSCRAVEHLCAENNIPTCCYHGDMPVNLRQKSMEEFAGLNVADGQQVLQPVMVATDLAARGLDFRIEHVINFDFPPNAVDYLHRTGRTARAGNSGLVTSLISSREKLLAARIEWALEHEMPLDKVTADPSRPNPWQSRPKPVSKVGSRSGLAAYKGVKQGGLTQGKTARRPPSSRFVAPSRQTAAGRGTGKASAKGGAATSIVKPASSPRPKLRSLKKK